MYGVLYAYTPEAFPTPHRGTGDALASAFNRVMGLIAPIIKIVTTSRDGSSNINANVYVYFVEKQVYAVTDLTLDVCRPVFISASLFVVSAILAVLLPIEVRQTHTVLLCTTVPDVFLVCVDRGQGCSLILHDEVYDRSCPLRRAFTPSHNSRLGIVRSHSI